MEIEQLLSHLSLNVVACDRCGEVKSVRRVFLSQGFLAGLCSSCRNDWTEHTFDLEIQREIVRLDAVWQAAIHRGDGEEAERLVGTVSELREQMYREGKQWVNKNASSVNRTG